MLDAGLPKVPPAPDYKKILGHLNTAEAWNAANERIERAAATFEDDAVRCVRLGNLPSKKLGGFQPLLTEAGEQVRAKAMSMHVYPDNPHDLPFFRDYFHPSWFHKLGGYPHTLQQLLDGSRPYDARYIAAFVSPQPDEIVPIGVLRGLTINANAGITPGFRQLFPVMTDDLAKVRKGPRLAKLQLVESQKFLMGLFGTTVTPDVKLGEIGGLVGGPSFGEGSFLQPDVLRHMRKDGALVYTGTFTKPNAASVKIAYDQGFRGVVLPWHVAFTPQQDGSYTIISTRLYVDAQEAQGVDSRRVAKAYDNMLRLRGAIPFEQFPEVQNQYYEDVEKMFAAAARDMKHPVLGFDAQPIVRRHDGPLRFEPFSRSLYRKFAGNRYVAAGLAILGGAWLFKDKLFGKKDGSMAA